MLTNESIRIIINMAYRLEVGAETAERLSFLQYLTLDDRLPPAISKAAATAIEHAEGFRKSLDALRNTACEQLFVDPPKPDA